MSHPPLPSPHDLINEPEAFDAEFERQLTLCLSGEPNRAREWSFAKLALALSAAESLLSDHLEPDLGPTRPLRETEKALKRSQIAIGRLFLTQLEHLRAGVRDPAIAAMFDTIAPLAITLGTVCHEVSPRTQEALGDQDHVRMRSADQAEIARRSANKRTQWMRDLMPVATSFLQNYRGTQTWTAKRMKFEAEFPHVQKSVKQLNALLKAASKELETTLDFRSSTNGC